MKKYRTEFSIGIMNMIMAPFAWSNWVDVLTFSFGSNAYLLQAKRNRRTNAKRFRVTEMKQRMETAAPSHVSMEELEERGLINKSLEYPKW